MVMDDGARALLPLSLPLLFMPDSMSGMAIIAAVPMVVEVVVAAVVQDIVVSTELALSDLGSTTSCLSSLSCCSCSSCCCCSLLPALLLVLLLFLLLGVADMMI